MRGKTILTIKYRKQDRFMMNCECLTGSWVAAGDCAVNRLKTDHGVEIHIGTDTDCVHIEGSRDGVASAKAELMDLVDKMVSCLYCCQSKHRYKETGLICHLVCLFVKCYCSGKRVFKICGWFHDDFGRTDV